MEGIYDVKVSSALETLEKRVKYVQSWQWRHHNVIDVVLVVL